MIRNIRSSLAVALAAAIASTSLHAASAQAEMSYANHSLYAHPAFDAPAYQVRLVGPAGLLREETVLAGEPIRFQPSDGRKVWNDGQYKFEIRPIYGMDVRGEGAAGGDAEVATKSVNADVVANGSFLVVNGQPQWAGDGAVESTAKGDPVVDQDPGGPITNAQLIATDLIVQGSECVGIDCVNGESFGFDTLRLKENNLRIKFDDTSNSAGFPNNDWQLTANDSASGGQNKFSIDDITNGKTPFTVEGNTPTNSLYLDSTGRIGFRTSTPVLDLHVATSNTPGMRLEQTNAGGFTAQTWDIASNEANFFVRDVTNGSRLPFRIRPGAPTSSIDIQADGKVGIGTASPDAQVHVTGSNRLLHLAGTTTSTRPIAMVVGGTSNNSIAWTANDVAVFDNNSTSSTVVHIVAPANKSAVLGFGSDTTRAAGLITYANSTNSLAFRTNSLSPSLNIASDGIVTFPLGIGTTTVQGDLTVTGTITPDYVFEEGFKVMPIEDHAAFMWQNKHLPMVEEARTNEQGKGLVNVGLRSQQLLEELEYAHVYIDQLHQRIKQLETDQNSLRDAVEKLQSRIKH